MQCVLTYFDMKTASFVRRLLKYVPDLDTLYASLIDVQFATSTSCRLLLTLLPNSYNPLPLLEPYVIHTVDHKQFVDLKIHTKMTFLSHKVLLLVELWLTVPLLWSVLVDGGRWEHGGIMRQYRGWPPRHSCQSFQITHYDSKDWRDTDTVKATANGTSPWWMDYTPVKPGEVATLSSSSYLLALWRAAAGFYCVTCHLLYWSVYYKIHNYNRNICDNYRGKTMYYYYFYIPPSPH